MLIVVDPSSEVPPFEQVRSAIADAIANREMAPGTRLPSVRGSAANLALAPNTVARAYRELEISGAVVGRGRTGTFVAEPTEQRASAAAAAAEFAGRVRSLGVEPDEAVRLVRAAFGLRTA